MSEYELADLYATYSMQLQTRLELVIALTTAVIIASYVAGVTLELKLLTLGLSLYTVLVFSMAIAVNAYLTRMIAVVEGLQEVGATQDAPSPHMLLMMDTDLATSMRPLYFGTFFLLWAGAIAFAILSRRKRG